MKTISRYVSLLRLSQWSKSLFVFIGIIYSNLFNLWPKALIASLVFSLIASCVYIFNDFLDRERDRLHPKKQFRPLASGSIPLTNALFFFMFLFVSSLSIAYHSSISLFMIIAAYFILNLAYNFILKYIPVLDVLAIAIGFLLRVLAGTVGIGIHISSWLLITATLLSLLIALTKRRMEKSLHLMNTVRPVLDKYSLEWLDELSVGTAIACFLTYLFYVIYVHESQYFYMLTLVFSALGLIRFLEITLDTATDDDPISCFLHDKISLLNGVCFVLITIYAGFIS